MNQGETCFLCLMVLQQRQSLSLLTRIRPLALLEAENSRFIRSIDVEGNECALGYHGR